MSLILKDPQTGPAPDGGPGILSTLPAGGTPADDRAFLAWVDREAGRLNARALDRLQARGVAPGDDVLRPFQAMNHLYKHLQGIAFPPGVGPTYSHKVRFLAIQHRLRPRELEAELDAYTRRLTEAMEPGA